MFVINCNYNHIYVKKKFTKKKINNVISRIVTEYAMYRRTNMFFYVKFKIDFYYKKCY